MSATIVSINENNVNATPEEVYVWADRSGDRGLLNPTTARLKVTALKRVLSVLSHEEKLGAQEILDSLDQLVTRLARKEGGTPETLQTYKQRSESLLRDYIDYQRDPLAFQARTAERPAKAEKKVERKKAQPEAASEKAQQQPPQQQQPQPQPQPSEGRRYVYPLADGRDFEYVLPRGGLTMVEVKKIALLLISLAKDYDPSAESITDLTRRVKPLDMLDDSDDDDKGDD